MKTFIMLSMIFLLISCREDLNKKENKIIDYPEYQIDHTSSVKITENGTIADINPFLPTLRKGEYRFVRFYNISSKDHYAILCVLEMIGVNDVNLVGYDRTTNRFRDVEPSSLNITGTSVDNHFGKKDFNNLKQGDKIVIVCYHDDDFDTTNSSDSVLNFYRSNLPNIYAYERKDIIKIRQPKKGNGGVLTVTAE